MPYRFTFTTASMLFWISWTAILLAHLRLSYPAIICRGHPPLDPDDLVALFIAPAFVGLPSIFGDTRRRLRGVLVGSAGFAIIYALVLINLNDTRPSIGHLAGIPGIVRTYHIGILVAAFVLYYPVALSLYFVECVIGDAIGFLGRYAGRSLRSRPGISRSDD